MSTATETFVPPVVTGQEDWNAPGLSEKERYGRYLCSRHWGVRREAVHRRANGICEHCKTAAISHVHHTTYARKYNEPLEDLMGVCEPCHNFIHGRSDVDPRANSSQDGNGNSSSHELREWEKKLFARWSAQDRLDTHRIAHVAAVQGIVQLISDPGYHYDEKHHGQVHEFCEQLNKVAFGRRRQALDEWLASRLIPFGRWCEFAVNSYPRVETQQTVLDWCAATYWLLLNINSIGEFLSIRSDIKLGYLYQE